MYVYTHTHTHTYIYIYITTEESFDVANIKLARVGFEATTTEFRSKALTYLSYQARSSSRTQRQLSTPTPSSSFAQCPISFRLLPFSVARLF